MKLYVQGVITGIFVAVSLFVLMGAQKNRSNTILEMIIEDQKDDLIIKEQVIQNEIGIKKNEKMIETKFRDLYRYLGEHCPCFDNLSNEF
tara:strand:- start:194 stop:463 length:270 start_codon:yes stop_codon:yes gene_type:complete